MPELYPDLYMGIMSGTSMDAIDAVLVDFSCSPTRCLHTYSHSFSQRLRAQLTLLCDPNWRGSLDEYAQIDAEVGECHAKAACELLRIAKLPPSAVTAIGSHGQTVRHRPSGMPAFSLQLGDPNRIAERTGITTVADFRRRDIAAGGQGAPLVPPFHAVLFHSREENRAVVNIGGIANVTLLPAADPQAIQGFDTGPGNALLDAWADRHLGVPMDRDGAWAAGGRVNEVLLARLLSDSWFGRPPPKSTGRELFNFRWLAVQLSNGLNDRGRQPQPEAVQATLTELTARSICDAIRTHGDLTRTVLVCGGGARNRYLMQRLAKLMPNRKVDTTAAAGVPPEWLEAMAFAWLARQTLRSLPGNVPAVTGARRPVILGGIYRK